MMKKRPIREPVATASAARSPNKVYEDHALSELRKAGYRITMPRVQVIRALVDTTTALSAYAIHEKITTSGGMIDVVSVYRILSTLQEIGLIYHIGVVDGYFPCRLPNATLRSEVIVDEETYTVKEFTLPEAVVDSLKKQASESKIEISAIKVEILGKTAK